MINQTNSTVLRWACTCALIVGILGGMTFLVDQPKDASASAESTVWVDYAQYGSAGGGFYWDFSTGQVWTAERGWHGFSPADDPAARPTLWVNYLTYGSAGGGFYLNTATGEVWTAERGWHAFSPTGVPPALAPTPAPTSRPSPTPLGTPTYSITNAQFCTQAIVCSNGPQALTIGSPILATFGLNPTPTEPVRTEGWWNGLKYADTSFPPPYVGVLFSTTDALGVAQSIGIVELRVWIGSRFIGSFNATVGGAPVPSTIVPPPPSGQITFAMLDGEASLVGSDGAYLGIVSSNRFSANSICNQFGTYGSQFSSTSVRNQFSQYGSAFSSKSAYNVFTSSPPSIIFRGSRVGYLTKNQFLSGAIDPDVLFAAYGCVYR